MRSSLWPILALFLALHAVYNWAVPLGEGPDEPGHLAYALFLAGEGRLPVQRATPEPSDVPGEGHQPPLAYALAAPAVAWLPEAERAILLTANPGFIWAGGDEPGAFMRGSRELWPWTGLTVAWHAVRAVSGLCGAAAVAFTYLAARCLRPDDRLLAPLAAALVALNPQLLFTTALATNDALLTALGGALLWVCLVPSDRRQAAGGRWQAAGGRRQATTGGRWQVAGGGGALTWGIAAGVLFGLALLTKQSALLLGPLVLWGGWRAAGGELRRSVAVTLAWGLTALLVAGWWYWRNLSLYGDLFGLGAFKAEFTTQPFVWGDPAAWAGALAQLFGSFWARFGWMSVTPPGWTLWVYAAVCALSVAGWARLSFHHSGAAGTAKHSFSSPWGGPALAVGMALAWTLAFAATAGLVAWQGRMLFPAIGAIALLLAKGLLGLRRKDRQQAQDGGQQAQAGGQQTTGTRARQFCILHSAFCILLSLLALLMPLAVIRPAYTWVALAPGVAQASLGIPAYGRFAASWERGVVLRGWRLDGPAAPGAELPVTLTWNSLEPVPRPWTVFVHLVDRQETIVAQSNRQPRGDTLPFQLWTPGDWVADTHLLALPANLPPGEYRLRVGLYRPDKDGRRQEAWAADGSELGDLVELGAVTVGR